MALFAAALLAAAPPLDPVLRPAASARRGQSPLLHLKDTTGTQHRLSDYRGKVVLVNFWATWCEPCREELPSIERLRASLADRPFAVLAVQMGGSPRTARDIAATLGLHFPVLLDGDSTATSAWRVDTLPTSFLVAPDGTVALTHAGEVDWSSARWRRKIELLLPR